MLNIKIGNYCLGENYEPFIVAEVGINHNGCLETAYKMIEVAARAGVSAVKFQTFKANEFVSDRTQMFTYFSQGKEITEPMLDMFERYEFSAEKWHLVKKKCNELGLMFFSTPQNYSDLEILLDVGVDAIKVGSDDFTNIPLLKKYASTGLPLIVSSGMSTLAEVYIALEAIGALDGYPTILLLCTSQYPTPPQDVNLNKLKTLKSAFPSVMMGFSDHTQGPLASSLAVSMGATFFEKHFTLDRQMPGPDHWFSEDPEGLMNWVQSIKTAYKMLGNHIVRPTKLEIDMKKIARRSIVAIQDIAAGEIFSEKNIGLKRPGEGLSPVWLEKIVGMKSVKDIKKNVQIKLGDMASVEEVL